MANQVNLSINVTNLGATAQATVAFNQALSNPGFIGSEQVIATTATELDLGAVGSTPLGVFVWNLDTANYIQVDANNSFNGFPQMVLAGQAIYLAPETGTIYAKAHTASVNVFVVAC